MSTYKSLSANGADEGHCCCINLQLALPALGASFFRVSLALLLSFRTLTVRWIVPISPMSLRTDPDQR
jgi:hypothetical protein